MAVSVGDVLQITDTQVFLGESMLNVYFYEVMVATDVPDYSTVRIAFEDLIIEGMIPFQSAFCEHVRVTIKNLTNGLDIAEFPVEFDGAVSGEASQSFVSLSCRLVRSTALTRHGSKRIGGLSEGLLNGNGLATGAIESIQPFVDKLALPIEVDSEVFGQFEARPVIVGRFLQGESNAGELDLSKINPVASAQFIRLTTQATRRAGRGI